ncbi:MAG: hypothetical protein J4N91_10105, partial [Chloroflexi bacterium]|nr:hypothetical protein [Chloroflexota bacterium]
CSWSYNRPLGSGAAALMKEVTAAAEQAAKDDPSRIGVFVSLRARASRKNFHNLEAEMPTNFPTSKKWSPTCAA